MKHSASSIKTFLDCPRKWAEIYLNKRRGEANEAADYGTFLHAIMELRRERGKWPTLGSLLTYGRGGDKTSRKVTQREIDILEEAQDKWGPYHEALYVAEGEFNFPSPTRPGRTWNGYRDLRSPKPSSEAFAATHVSAVVDYKSTSNFKYALLERAYEADPPDEHRFRQGRFIDEDVQAVLYGHSTILEDGTPGADLEWIYMFTGLPNKSKSVRLRVSQEYAAAGFEALEKIADQAEAVTSSATAEQNFNSCSKFGGCPFQADCHGHAPTLSFSQRRLPVMSNMNDLLALVSQQRTAQGVPPPASTVAPVAREVTPAGTVTTFDASWAAAGKTAAPPQAVNPPVTQTAAALPPSVAGKDYDKTPPPPPVSVPPPADVRIRRTKDEIARGLTPEQAVAERMTARSTPPLLPAGPGSQHMAPADQLAAKTPEQIAAEGGFTSGGGGAGPATVSGATVAPRTSPTSEGLNIRTLYIGCLPVRAGGVVHFDLAVAHARVQLAKQGLADYRLAEYGKGKAYLLEHVISYLAKECAGQDVFVAHGGDEATVCLPHLRAAAREVVQNVAVAA